MWFFGPPRSKFGKWIDKHELTHIEVSKRSGVPRTTITELATGSTKKPTRLTSRKIIESLKEVDPRINHRDFWDM